MVTPSGVLLATEVEPDWRLNEDCGVGCPILGVLPEFAGGKGGGEGVSGIEGRPAMLAGLTGNAGGV